MEIETNRIFAATNVPFQNACKKAGIPATARQASKYRRNKGLAFKFRKHPTTKYLLRQVKLNLNA